MATQLEKTANLLKTATAPEDVFGDLGDDKSATLSEVFRRMALHVHPDKNANDAERAKSVFQSLTEWRNRAEERIKAGVYGDRSKIKEVVLTTKKSTYTLSELIATGDISTVYRGTLRGSSDPMVFKVCRNPANNAMLDVEQSILTYLRDEAVTCKLKAMVHIVPFVESFMVADGKVSKRVNVFKYSSANVSLADVAKAYPAGIDMRDAAWMLNRIIAALVVLEQAKVVHGAIVPEHVLIAPESHNAILVGWSYAVRNGNPISAIVPSRKADYPRDVLSKRPSCTGMDLHMAAKTILGIVNPHTVPRQINGLLRTCLLGAAHRPNSAYDFYQDFNAELNAAFGPKKFREFKMP